MAEGWEILVFGSPMYQLIKKLKNVKQVLIKWSKESCLLNPSNNCILAKDILQPIQRKLGDDPLNVGFLNEEKNAMDAYYEATKNEESMRLVSRTTWLKCGDNNARFVHTMQKIRNSTNTVYALKSQQGA